MQFNTNNKPNSTNNRDLNKGESILIRVQTNTDEREASSDEPILRFPELLKVTKVGRSKAYDLMNPKSPTFDPEYPAGFPLFDSPRSPKAYWRHEALAWIEGRSNKFRNKQQGYVTTRNLVENVVVQTILRPIAYLGKRQMKRASLMLAFLFVFAFAGVADAKKFKWDAARKIQTGMTIKEVTQCACRALQGRQLLLKRITSPACRRWHEAPPCYWSMTTKTRLPCSRSSLNRWAAA